MWLFVVWFGVCCLFGGIVWISGHRLELSIGFGLGFSFGVGVWGYLVCRFVLVWLWVFWFVSGVSNV